MQLLGNRTDQTLTVSGSTVRVADDLSASFTCTLPDGYEIATATFSDYFDDNSTGWVVGSIEGNVISGYCIDDGSHSYSGVLTIASRAASDKQALDISTLSGWANLSSGEHSITIKTGRGDSPDSASSNAVTVTKAVRGYTLKIEGGPDYGSDITINCIIDGQNVSLNDIESLDYTNKFSFKFSINYGSSSSLDYVWRVSSPQLGIDTGDQPEDLGVVYTSDAFTLTEDTTITISTEYMR